MCHRPTTASSWSQCKQSSMPVNLALILISRARISLRRLIPASVHFSPVFSPYPVHLSHFASFHRRRTSTAIMPPKRKSVAAPSATESTATPTKRMRNSVAATPASAPAAPQVSADGTGADRYRSVVDSPRPHSCRADRLYIGRSHSSDW